MEENSESTSGSPKGKRTRETWLAMVATVFPVVALLGIGWRGGGVYWTTAAALWGVSLVMAIGLSRGQGEHRVRRGVWNGVGVGALAWVVNLFMDWVISWPSGGMRPTVIADWAIVLVLALVVTEIGWALWWLVKHGRRKASGSSLEEQLTDDSSR